MAQNQKETKTLFLTFEFSHLLSKVQFASKLFCFKNLACWGIDGTASHICKRFILKMIGEKNHLYLLIK